MIVCLGSVNNDLFFQIPKLLPAGQINVTDSHVVTLGGKGANQAAAAARAGAEVRFFGCVGKDAVANDLIHSLHSIGISTQGILRKDLPSGTAAIIVDGNGDHINVYSKGANNEVKAEQVPAELLNSKTLVLLQGDISMRENEILLQRASQSGAKTLLNLGPPAFISPAALKYVDYLLLNEPEANALAEQLGVSSQDKKIFSRFLSRTFETTAVITLGKEGAIATDPRGETYSVGTIPIIPVDMVGAGDAFIGYFSASIDAGLSLEQSLLRASIAGSLTCLSVGAQTAMPTPEQVQARISELKVDRSRPVNV